MRLIDADALKKRILEERDKIPLTVPAATYELVKEKANLHGNAMRGGIRVALRCMEQTPSIDAVEVVRCKDCILFQPYIGEEHKGDCEVLVGFESCVYEDDFCSYGRRCTERP